MGVAAESTDGLANSASVRSAGVGLHGLDDLGPELAWVGHDAVAVEGRDLGTDAALSIMKFPVIRAGSSG
jgi:hypothetical protein